MAKKKRTYGLKIRSYPDGSYVSVWLYEVQGPTSGRECRLFGEMPKARAEELAEVLGLPVERDRSPIEGGGIMPE